MYIGAVRNFNFCMQYDNKNEMLCKQNTGCCKTTLQTYGHSSFDFNFFLLLTLGNYAPKGVKNYLCKFK